MQKLAPRITLHDDQASHQMEVQGRSGPIRGIPTEESPELVFHTRRPHHKSRTGCVVCKKRRVKCDEKKPSCGRCEYRGASCVYEKPEQISRSRKSPGTREQERDESVGTGSPSGIMVSATNTIAETAIQDSLQSDTLGSLLSRTNATDSSVSPKLLESLRHFDIFTSHTMGAPIARHVIRSKVLPLALSAPCLMHSLIATSISHLRYLQPINHNATLVSEAYHWQEAIRLFQKEITSPVKLENMDSVISTSMLLAVLAHTSDNNDPSASWVFSRHASTSWLFVQGGLTTLMENYSSNVANSIWMPVILDADDFTGSQQIQMPGRDGIADDFAELCDIDDSSSGKNNPYHEALRTLTALLQLDFVPANFAKFVYFMRVIRGDYRTLLHEKDDRALLILGYWFAILCKINQWWIQDRVKLECRFVCMYLEYNEDPRIVKLLEFPAEACGYALAASRQYTNSLNVDTGNVPYMPAFQHNITGVEYDTP